MVNKIIFEIGGLMKEALTSSIYNEEFKYLKKTYPKELFTTITLEQIEKDKKNLIVLNFLDTNAFDRVISEMRGRGAMLASKSFRMMGVKLTAIRQDKEIKLW